jgi:hypothetical protein
LRAGFRLRRGGFLRNHLSADFLRIPQGDVFEKVRPATHFFIFRFLK